MTELQNMPIRELKIPHLASWFHFTEHAALVNLVIKEYMLP